MFLCLLTAREGGQSADDHSGEKDRPEDCLFLAIRRLEPKCANAAAKTILDRPTPPKVAPFYIAANMPLV